MHLGIVIQIQFLFMTSHKLYVKRLVDISTVIWINIYPFVFFLSAQNKEGELRCSTIDAFRHSQRVEHIFIFEVARNYCVDIMTAEAQSI